MNVPNSQPDAKLAKPVVLIHGWSAQRFLMWPLAWYLNRGGYSTTTFGYRSCWWSIEHHANRFRKVLDRLQADESVESFDVVSHSMGGIVTRQAILDGQITKLRRFVQLAPPNQGSPVARFLGTVNPLWKTLRQISDRPNSFVLDMPQPSGIEIGIVAAQYDRVVPEPNSHLTNEKDHISVFSGHNGLLARPKAFKQVREFLDHGKFSR